jgi:hypothetical protein
MTTTTKRIPKSACRLRVGGFHLAKDGGKPDSKRALARILARSRQAIPHWFWGQLVHDFSGMEMAKDRLALDYNHDPGQILGYAENWSTESGDLECDGTLLTERSSRAAEIVGLAADGVPYEASISFTPFAVQYLDDGEMASVNEQMVEGPAAIIRRWDLYGLAVCPHGADPNTRTDLSGKDGEVEITILSQEGQRMSDEQKTPEEIRAEMKASQLAFVEKYGSELADKWGPFGKCELSMDSVSEHLTAVREQHATELSNQVAASEKAITELKASHDKIVADLQANHDKAITDLQAQLNASQAEAKEAAEKLAAIKVGEDDPASTGAGQPSFLSDGSGGISRYAAAMRARAEKN